MCLLPLLTGRIQQGRDTCNTRKDLQPHHPDWWWWWWCEILAELDLNYKAKQKCIFLFKNFSFIWWSQGHSDNPSYSLELQQVLWPTVSSGWNFLEQGLCPLKTKSWSFSAALRLYCSMKLFRINAYFNPEREQICGRSRGAAKDWFWFGGFFFI